MFIATKIYRRLFEAISGFIFDRIHTNKW